MTLTTPTQWLPWLTQKLDDRQHDLTRLRSYLDGNAPLPEMGKNTRATWLAFQKKARTNYGLIACQSHANRIRVRGVRVGEDDKSTASVTARRIARDNRLPMVVSDAVWDMLAVRVGYIVTGLGPDGKAVITAERPEQFYAEPDPLYPWRSRAAVKVWRDAVAERDHAIVWASGVKQRFTRRSATEAGPNQSVLATAVGEWHENGAERYTGGVPVYIFDRRDGMGLIEPHLDVLDRINAGKLQRLSIAAIQAFKQRALKKQPGVEMSEVDESGNPIDWQSVFEPAPGALWDLPAGIDIWESPSTDLTPLMNAEKADARDFAAATGTPIVMLQPDAANQSAAGAHATTQQQVDACESDISRIRLAAASAMAAALRFEGVDIGDDTVEVDFESPAWTTLGEKLDAFTKAVSSGVSIATAQKLILGWTQEQIDEDQRNRERERAAAPQPPASNSEPGESTPTEPSE